MKNIIFADKKEIVVTENHLLIIVEAKDDSLTEFYRLLKKSLHFPDYFRENLDSLDEMLCDLSWLPAQTIQIHFEHINQFLKKNPKRTIVFELLDNVKEYWETEGSKTMIWSAAIEEEK